MPSPISVGSVWLSGEKPMVMCLAAALAVDVGVVAPLELHALKSAAAATTAATAKARDDFFVIMTTLLCVGDKARTPLKSL
jgi:hypothetical protein